MKNSDFCLDRKILTVLFVGLITMQSVIYAQTDSINRPTDTLQSVVQQAPLNTMKKNASVTTPDTSTAVKKSVTAPGQKKAQAKSAAPAKKPVPVISKPTKAPMKRRDSLQAKQQSTQIQKQQPVATQKKQQPAPIQKQQPIATQQKQQPAQIQKQLPTVMQQKQQPAATQQKQQPTPAQKQQSAVTQQKQQSATTQQKQQPAPIQKQQPIATQQKQQPAPIQKQQPIATQQKQQPAPIQKQQPIATQQKQQPAPLQKQQPVVTTTQKPLAPTAKKTSVDSSKIQASRVPPKSQIIVVEANAEQFPDTLKAIWFVLKDATDRFLAETSTKGEFESTTEYNARIGLRRQQFIVEINKYIVSTRLDKKKYGLTLKATLTQYHADGQQFTIDCYASIPAPYLVDELVVDVKANPHLSISDSVRDAHRFSKLYLNLSPSLKLTIPSNQARSMKADEAAIFFRVELSIDINQQNITTQAKLLLVPHMLQLINVQTNKIYWEKKL